MAARAQAAAAPKTRPSRGRNLKVVGEEAPEPKGDLSLTAEAIAGWREGQRRCRARGRHNWGPYTVFEYRGHFEVIEQCPHCRNRRVADFAKTGRKLSKWKPDYREGYLLPKGAARLDEDMKDELVLADILSRRIVEAPDPEDED